MELTEQKIRQVVAEVVKNLDFNSQGLSFGAAAPSAPMPAGAPAAGTAGIFGDLDSAVQAAKKAHRDLMAMKLETRGRIVGAMREAALANLELISKKAVEETGMGSWKDKVLKNRVAALMTPGTEDLQPTCYTDDHGLTLTERAPYGVVGAITPSTNPTATIINNGISILAGGNSVVFNVHPGAKSVSATAIALLNEAIVKAGGPPNMLTGVTNPTIQSAQELMGHRDVALLVVTGGPGVVREAMKHGKKVIAAGPGNPPVVVDETADLRKAGKDIVNGAGFDNNIVCICEKEILAVDSIVDELKSEIVKNGGFELDSQKMAKVTDLVIAEPGGPGKEGFPNKQWVGKDAAKIAREVGVETPKDTKILFCEVPQDHPLVWTEQLLPVIPLVRLGNVDTAIDLAVRCEHGFRHTAVMHSRNIEKLSRMAKVMNCSLFVKNGPCYSGMGYGGAGFTSLTIASPTGEGLTRARTFTRERRCTLVDYFRIV
jgi:acyl-CoA reductase-like NAD-dependent aldehyde dehydrogenase